MNELDYADVETAVLRELGEGAVSLTGDIVRYKKSVLRDIAAFHQWSWLENVPLTLSTDSGQTYITVPDYLDGEITIHQDDSGREIRYVPPQEYARLLGISTNTTDKPDYHTVRAGRIEFYMPLTTGSSVKVFGTIDADQVDKDDANAIEGIALKIPSHFSTIVEWGILRKLDSDNVQKAQWRGFYFAELKVKRTTDGVSKGRTIIGQKDRAILNSRSYLRG